MKNAPYTIGLTLLGCALAFAGALAQSRDNPPLRDIVDREGAPMWQVESTFPNEMFTFVRVRYDSVRGDFRAHWSCDYPGADLNFSYRLQELTALDVSPDGLIVDLTDKELLKHPFAFMSSPGRMLLNSEDAAGLRNYVMNGGFLMVDDCWGKEHLENVKTELAKALPGVTPVNLPLSHPIFHIVYDLQEKPQVPSINAFNQGLEIEPWHGDMTDPAPHFLAYHDKRGRIMILLCHNNDLADGWEREGENLEYYKRYSERWSYPMGVNIIAYAMSH